MPYPAKKNPKLIEEVLSRLARGETLAMLGRELGFSPMSWSRWTREDEALGLLHAHAREAGEDALADQALELIDSEPDRVDGKIDPGYVQWKRAQVDTRLKLLACWNPKKYGTKQTVDVGNKEGETLKVESNVDNTTIITALTEALLTQGKSK